MEVRACSQPSFIPSQGATMHLRSSRSISYYMVHVPAHLSYTKHTHPLSRIQPAGPAHAHFIHNTATLAFPIPQAFFLLWPSWETVEKRESNLLCLTARMQPAG